MKWKFTGGDHPELENLNLFKILHKGNGDKDDILRKAWGRKVEFKCQTVDSQST